MWPFSAIQQSKGLRDAMIKPERLRKNYEFKFVYGKGKVYSNNILVLYIIENNADYNRVGFSVSKKVGKSVIRNKVRRKIKECYRLNSSNIKKGYNMVFVSRVRAKDANYNEIDKAMLSLFRKCQILLEER
jgi:ribonuclease P protein component